MARSLSPQEYRFANWASLILFGLISLAVATIGVIFLCLGAYLGGTVRIIFAAFFGLLSWNSYRRLKGDAT